MEWIETATFVNSSDKTKGDDTCMSPPWEQFFVWAFIIAVIAAVFVEVFNLFRNGIGPRRFDRSFLHFLSRFFRLNRRNG